MSSFVDAGWGVISQNSSIPGWERDLASAEGRASVPLQTLTRETMARINDQHNQYAISATPPIAIVAPEGSELASSLRSRGWVARSGWRSRRAGTTPVWMVRFEQPLEQRQ